MKFVIVSPGWDSLSGGLIALNKLADNLSILGQDVYICSHTKNPQWGGKLIQNIDGFDLGNTIVIYPEIILNNPLNAIYICRWLLNSVGIVGGNDSTWSDSDFVFTYADYFICSDKFKIEGNLRAMDMQLDFWQNENKPRNEVCHLIKKGVGKPLVHDANSICIDGMNHQQIKAIFNKSSLLISYDNATMYSIFAVMCGCVSYVIPDGFTNKEDWKETFPYFKYGVNYGMEDVEGTETMHLARENILSLEAETLALTSEFIEYCRKRIEND